MNELLVVARSAADAAAQVHRQWIGKVGMVEARAKGTADFVSQVDLESQEAALRLIRNAFPDHRIVAEEEGSGLRVGDATRGDGSTPVWVVDPLDGTTNFLHGHPAHCSSVGVVVDGVAVAGAVTAQATGERWWACQGEGAFRNGERIRVSRAAGLSESLVGTGFPFKHLQHLPEYLPQLERVLRATSGIRRGGSAALDFCYLAQGSLDLFWEFGLGAWDMAAGLALLAEAGGVAERMDGGPIDPLAGGGVLGGNSPELLGALRGLVRG